MLVEKPARAPYDEDFHGHTPAPCTHPKLLPSFPLCLPWTLQKFVDDASCQQVVRDHGTSPDTQPPTRVRSLIMCATYLCALRAWFVHNALRDAKAVV